MHEQIKFIFGLNNNVDLLSVKKADFLSLVRLIQLAQDPKMTEAVFECQKLPLENQISKYKKYLESLAEKNPEKFINLNIDSTSSLEIRPQHLSNLANCMGHILRNSFDHGLENSEDRELKNKNPIGQITIKAVESSDGSFELTIKDDGKGIQTDRLVQKAVKNNLWSIQKAESASEIEKINLIFHSGLSTNDTVSDTSGRGVGMDAVKSEVEEKGGTIEIKTKIDIGTEFTLKMSNI